MSPKIVNGSFAAIFDADEFLAKSYAGIRIAHQESPSMRRRVRGILMSGKQFSLDSHMDIVVHTCLDSSTTPSTTTTTYDSTKPIREDNEDGWEAYESLGTPPRTPSPMISPLILTPSNSYNTIYYPAKTSPLPDDQFGVVRTPNRKPPNTLTLPTKNSYIIDNTVFMHNFETSMSHNSHQYASTPSPVISSSHNRSFFLKTRSSNSSLCSPTAAAGRSGSKRKNIYVYSCNGRQNSIRTQFKQEEEVYHGKRYLDPVIEAVDGCAFVNDGFRAVSVTTRQEFRSNTFGCTVLPEIAEIQSPGTVDWEAVRANFRGERARLRRGSNSFPKFRIRINDEHGNRIKSSFESSSGPEDQESSSSPITPDTITPDTVTPPDKVTPVTEKEVWSSSESTEKQEDAIVSKDGWTIESSDSGDGDEEKKFCQKCGHSATSRQSSSSSSS